MKLRKANRLQKNQKKLSWLVFPLPLLKLLQQLKSKNKMEQNHKHKPELNRQNILKSKFQLKLTLQSRLLIKLWLKHSLEQNLQLQLLLSNR